MPNFGTIIKSAYPSVLGADRMSCNLKQVLLAPLWCPWSRLCQQSTSAHLASLRRCCYLVTINRSSKRQAILCGHSAVEFSARRLPVVPPRSVFSRGVWRLGVLLQCALATTGHTKRECRLPDRICSCLLANGLLEQHELLKTSLASHCSVVVCLVNFSGTQMCEVCDKEAVFVLLS